MTLLLVWIVVVPLLVGAVLLLFARQASVWPGWLALAAASASLLMSLIAVDGAPDLTLHWLPLAGEAWSLNLSTRDGGAVLASLVSLMAVLVFVYSQADVRGRPGQGRFFGFMSLFLGAMQWVSLSADLLTLLIGWELVGMCSYALIAFELQRSQATAGLRAFVTTRSADLGLYLAAMAAFVSTGSFDFADLADAETRNWILLGIVVAAAGKSAQLPFSGWLSGAMLGPTPVSALLHSATMVAAGAFLLMKAQALLLAVPWGVPVVLWLALATAVTASVAALYQAELKQLLAASTVSNFGYIWAALAVGSVAAGGFYLLTHALFKALLFLGAGVLVHQGLKCFADMGGLRRYLPVTGALFFVGVAALAAVPPLGGFFAKEAVVTVVHEHSLIAVVLVWMTAFLTAAYGARAWLGTFSDFSGPPARAPARPPMMQWLPIAILAVGSVLVALLAWEPLKKPWSESLGAESWPALSLRSSAVTIALVAGAIGWMIWHHRRPGRLPVPGAGSGLGRAAARWFGLVAGLDGIGRLMHRGAAVLARLERKGLEAIEQRGPTIAAATARAERAALERWLRPLTLFAGRMSSATDTHVIERLLLRLTMLLDAAGASLRSIQSGLLHHYYRATGIVLAALIAYGLIVFQG